jgi:hypothetical protein
MGVEYNPIVPIDGLVMYIDAANIRSYPGTGNTANSLTGNISGTLNNTVGFSNTNKGYFTFNDATDCISLGNPSVLQGLQINYTLSCWFNQQSTLQYATLYSDYSAVSSHRLVSLLRIDSGSLVYYTSTSNGNYQSIYPASITNGAWYFVSVTISGTLGSPSASVFLNGTTYTYSLSAMSSTPYTGSTHCIGGNVHNNENFNGNISQVQIYNRALSALEILQIYNSTKQRYGL